MRRASGLVVAAYLLVLVPLGFANELFMTVPSLGMRGAPAVIELAAHGVAAALCAAAGWMLLVRAPAGPAAAALAVAASALVSIQSLVWSRVPRDVAPGTLVPRLLLALATAALLLGLVRAARGERP